jgi:hypothetical protein
MSGPKLNRAVLSILPLLILTGIVGFLIPEQYTLTSGAAPYNMFHIVSGAIGLFIVSTGEARFPVFFNIGFGLFDLYQAVASFFGLSPIQYFHWTSVDDLLHVTLGVALILIGCYALRNSKGRVKLCLSQVVLIMPELDSLGFRSQSLAPP